MVPLDALSFENEYGENGEDCNGNHFLYHFQLHQIKGTAVSYESHPVGWNLTEILRESQKPGKHYNQNKRSMVSNDIHGLKFEMTIPGKSHEDIGDYQKSDGVCGVHLLKLKSRLLKNGAKVWKKI